MKRIVFGWPYVLPAGPALVSLALVACGNGDAAIPSPGPKPAAAADVAVVPLPLVTDGSDLGAIRGVAEKDGSFVAFGDRGISEVMGGAVVAHSESVKEWAAADRIPAADGTGAWAAGLTMDGRLVHLLADERLEDVGLRYGVAAGERVVAFHSLGATSVAIALEAELVVADAASAKTMRYPTGKLTALTTHAALVAGIIEGGAVVIDVATGKLTKRDLSGVTAVAFDHDGKLLVATDHVVYREAGAVLEAIVSRPDVRIGGLASTPERTWITEGPELWALDAAGLHRATGASVEDGATLVGSESGDAWLLGTKPARFHVDGVSGEDVWRQKALPVYERVCRECHAPTGASGIDLSTYDGWAKRRDVLRDRVLVKGDMPPKPRELTADERSAIDAFLSGVTP